MRKIAFICGGNSVESEISLLTGLKICKKLKEENKEFLLIYLQNDQFYLVDLLDPDFINKKKYRIGQFVKRKDRYFFQTKLKKYYFDYTLILGHGKNIEDGSVKAYFDNLQIPCLSESIYNGVVVQDKSIFKSFLKELKVNTLPYKVIYKHQINNGSVIKSLLNMFDFPLIVKPSTLGSSIGINKVENANQLPNALFEASLYDNKILLEPFIENKQELNIAIIGYQDDLEVSEIESVNDNAFVLSFYDKYDYSKGNNKRIINPNISPQLKVNLENIAKKIFKSLNLCGIVRFDFILDINSQKLYLNEANLIPGSIAYYLFEKEYSLVTLVDKYVELLIRKYKDEQLLLKKYHEGFINKIDLSKLKK